MDTDFHNYKGGEKKEALIGIVKGILGTIPYLGSILNEALFDIRARVQQNRINDFVTQLVDYLDKIDKAKIDSEFLKTPEFIDILESLLSKSIKTKHAEKVKLYSRIIGADISQGFIKDYDLELSFINIIDQLTINELLALKYLLPKKDKSFDLFPDNPETKARREEYYRIHFFDFHPIQLSYENESLFGVKTNEARIAIEGLIAKSLAYDDSASRIDTKPRTFVGLTPLGSELIQFIEEKNDL